MAQKAKSLTDGRISGQTIIDELIRNTELGQFEMGYSVLLPCIFSIYLHPDDHARLKPVFDLVRADARKALSDRMTALNQKTSVFGRRKPGKAAKEYKAASRDWTLEFYPDTEGTVPPGDVEIHSELNELPQPGYHGTRTTLIGREPSVTGKTTGFRETPKAAPRVYAEIRYRDDSGPQLYSLAQDEIIVGRGGDGRAVDLALYTNEEVSREHFRLRRDPARGRFTIVDQSMNGTWLDGRRLDRGVEEALPDRAEIGVAEALTLTFEVKR